MIENHELPKKTPYKREEDLGKEGVKKIGIGLIIVDIDTGKIWSILEKEKKSSTQRKIGQISIPMETRKTGETIMDNAIGGLSEFRELQIGEELIWIDGGCSYRGRFPFVEGVLADIILIGIRNRQPEKNLRLKNNEVDSIGWKDLDELINEPHLRKGVRGFLELARKEKWIDTFVERARLKQEGQRIIERGDPILKYKETRAVKKDVRLN